MYWVYILRSIKFNKTYTGITDDFERRLKQHNRGYHFYTRRYKPWKIVYKEQLANRIEAREREKYFKSNAGRKWLKKNLFETTAEVVKLADTQS